MTIHKSAPFDSKDYSSESQSYVDEFGRRIDNLRISLTQSCCFSCFFCHHEGENDAGAEMKPEDIERIVKHASRRGVHHVKLTGGEPLLRTDILDIIRRISPLVPDLSMTTNGLFLEDMALDLKEAGLTRVNVSIHTLDSEIYHRITGSNDLEQVKRGVRNAVDVGLIPVKVNMTILRGYNEDSIGDMMDFASDMGVTLQIIELQQIPGDNPPEQKELWVDLGPLEEDLKKRAIKAEKRSMHGRFQYTIPLDLQRNVVVEIVRPMHNSAFCGDCTRLRVTSDGKLKPCLYRQDNLVQIFSSEEHLGEKKTIQHAFEQAISRREPFWRDEHRQ
ncbi:MAG: GTP 3',8-cyclase MoaA [Candidatus Thorarchaeota archaeon]|nr:GTP 3',8-cyclase MoaA [Candidatus Thorarchaeota archaeon]